MEVLLKITSYHRLSPEIEATKLVENTLTFGRSQDCGWHLPDPEKVISNKHGEIVNEGGLFYVHDYSTNGLFVNHSVSPIGKGGKHQLVDGDVFSVGDFQIEVALQGDKGNSLQIEEVDFPLSDQKQAASVQSTFPDSASAPYQADNMLEESMTAPVMTPVSGDDGSSSANLIPEDWGAFAFSDGASLDPFSGEGQIAPQPQPQPQPQPESNIESISPPISEGEGRMYDVKKQASHTSVGEQGSAGNQQALMQAFLEGLGVSSVVRAELETEKQWFEMGVGLNSLLMGVINSLRQRASMKNQMKINRTMFQVEQNNPLKFSATIDDAIQNLYTRKSTSFLGAASSIKESFDDLHRHENATLAAASSSLEALLKLLGPESISRKADENNSLLKFMPNNSGAASWKIYQELHQEYSKEVDQKGVMALSDEFLNAYDNYINKQD
ncbi:type VI secretion system-associated FHA domain protein TagH [Marinomonas lutimaris]|uniref:type VI secretion system-associated FHA domain protein TagH n=1 Tax=Marinomonas lutimaris TaxID=2846746 RepID=UPI001CA5D63D|nr:type VI secretion system-associated FHA domain protein TagH [Marinomonas lutimaris]